MHGGARERGHEENQCKGEQTRIASLNHVVNTQTKTETQAREGDSRTGDLAVIEKMKWLGQSQSGDLKQLRATSANDILN